MNMRIFYWIALALAVIGSLNWGFIAFFDTNIITSVFGNNNFVTVLYALISFSGIYLLIDTVRYFSQTYME